MKCVECETQEAELDDPRVPAIEEGICLCRDCYHMGAEDRIYDLQFEIEQLRASLANLFTEEDRT